MKRKLPLSTSANSLEPVLKKQKIAPSRISKPIVKIRGDKFEQQKSKLERLLVRNILKMTEMILESRELDLKNRQQMFEMTSLNYIYQNVLKT